MINTHVNIIKKKVLQFIINSQTPEIAEKYQLRESVGLAAPQVGILKRVVVMKMKFLLQKLVV